MRWLIAATLIACAVGCSPAADTLESETTASGDVLAGGPHLALGTPGDGTAQDDYVLQRAQYALSYNRFRNTANWVSWHLVAADYGDAPRRSGSFLQDPALPDGWYAVRHRDYTNSGYDRGHM